MPFHYKHIDFTKSTWVQCINADFDPDQRLILPHLPRISEYYCIRQVNCIRNAAHDLRQYILLLDQIINPKVKVMVDGEKRFIEPGFRLSRFFIISGSEDVERQLQSFYDILNTPYNGSSKNER